ncbi:hypothetical protein BDW75DRAFT_131773 [Aspergillus navahoensis]
MLAFRFDFLQDMHAIEARCCFLLESMEPRRSSIGESSGDISYSGEGPGASCRRCVGDSVIMVQYVAILSQMTIVPKRASISTTYYFTHRSPYNLREMSIRNIFVTYRRVGMYVWSDTRELHRRNSAITLANWRLGQPSPDQHPGRDHGSEGKKIEGGQLGCSILYFHVIVVVSGANNLRTVEAFLVSGDPTFPVKRSRAPRHQAGPDRCGFCVDIVVFGVAHSEITCECGKWTSNALIRRRMTFCNHYMVSLHCLP